MDFAPYQDVSPDRKRGLSSVTHISHDKSSPPCASSGINDPWENSTNQTEIITSYQEPGVDFNSSASPRIVGTSDIETGRDSLNEFETSLPIRLDYEACLAYFLLPPTGGIFLLVIEKKSDYVRSRFHAWQSSMLFSFIFILYLVFSWSSFLRWIFFFVYAGLTGYLALRAYKDAYTLDRFKVPFFGPLASRIVGDDF